jgi:hypothetical protein
VKTAVSSRPDGLRGFFIATFAAFAMTSLLFDRAGAMNTVAPDSLDPFGRALFWYGVRFDPLVAENPFFLQVMSGVSAFLFGPLYVYLAHGFLKRRNEIRVPAIAYAWVMLYSMAVHVAVELWGERPPPYPLVFIATYAIYIIAPVLLLWRMRPARPFG